MHDQVCTCGVVVPMCNVVYYDDLGLFFCKICLWIKWGEILISSSTTLNNGLPLITCRNISGVIYMTVKREPMCVEIKFLCTLETMGQYGYALFGTPRWEVLTTNCGKMWKLTNRQISKNQKKGKACEVVLLLSSVMGYLGVGSVVGTWFVGKGAIALYFLAW